MAAQPLDQPLQRKGRLDRDQIADQPGNPLALHRLGYRRQSLAPARTAQLATLADVGRIEPLTPQAVPDEAGLVADPFLIHAVVVARDDPHHFAALGIDADVAAQSVHHVDGLGLGQLPRPRGKGVGLGGQRADRAEVDDVALQVRVKRLVQVAGDLGIFAAPGLAHLGDPGDFRGEAHAAGAGNAARHRGGDQRAEVQILARPFRFAVTAEIDAVGHRLILQIALAALIADRAVERVVDQQELHHAFTGVAHHRGVGLDHRRLAVRAGAQVAHLHGAACGGLRRAAGHFHQAHPAVARDGQPLVVAKARDLHPSDFRRLDQRHRAIDLDHDAVDADFLEVSHEPAPPSLRPRGGSSARSPCSLAARRRQGR